MKDKKFDFYFPSEVLKDEDFSPVDIFILKDYYRNAFLELIDSVRFYIIKFLDWKRHTKKIIYRSILFWCAKSSFNTIRF